MAILNAIRLPRKHYEFVSALQTDLQEYCIAEYGKQASQWAGPGFKILSPAPTLPKPWWARPEPDPTRQSPGRPNSPNYSSAGIKSILFKDINSYNFSRWMKVGFHDGSWRRKLNLGGSCARPRVGRNRWQFANMVFEVRHNLSLRNNHGAVWRLAMF